MAKNKIFQRLRKELGLITKNVNGTPQTLPVNDKGKVIGNIDRKASKQGILQSSKFKEAWDWWTSSTYDNPSSFKNRKQRYDDLYFMYYNSAIASTAIEMLADETLQSDSQEEYIQVFAKDKKLQNRINELFSLWDISQSKLRDVAFNLALTGDSFWANSIDPKKGVKEVIPVGVYNVTDRLEFSLSHITKQYMSHKKGAYQSYWNRNSFLQNLFQVFQEDTENDISDMFRSYTFGYVINEEDAVPPWTITHFRRFSSESEFFPFGKPAYIHAIAPYRQLASAMNLQAMARVANFPIKIMKVKNSEYNTEMDSQDVLNRVRQDYENIGVTNTGKDSFTVNDIIWMMEDLMEIQIESPNISLDDIADIEMYQDQLLTAFRLPKGVIPIGNDNSWGDSGKALVQQSKVFGRLVYTNQQAIIKGLIDLVNLHFSITGEYEDPEFEISVPFPEVEQDRDKMSMKNDSLRLANDIVSNLKDALGLDRDESLPIDIVKDVFQTYSFMDDSQIDQWFKDYQKAQEEKEKRAEEEGEFGGVGYREHKERVVECHKKARKRYFESDTIDFTIREAYFKALKERNLFEGVKVGRHYYSSLKKDREREAWYDMLRGSKRGKLQEGKNAKTLEELKKTMNAKGDKLDGKNFTELKEFHKKQVESIQDIAEKVELQKLKKFFKL